TYVLQSEKDGNLYIGFTDNVEKRLREHNEGINISTKSRVPFKLLELLRN
ncbi:MAG: GIY-YIG nuclease family protein, partial [Patescibacteria group bacterium]